MSDRPKFGSNSRNDAWEKSKSKEKKGSSQNTDSGPDSGSKECPEIPGSRAKDQRKRKDTDFKDMEHKSNFFLII
jgi:hypothetical protein